VSGFGLGLERGEWVKGVGMCRISSQFGRDINVVIVWSSTIFRLVFDHSNIRMNE